jgi:hypothetical protein
LNQTIGEDAEARSLPPQFGHFPSPAPKALGGLARFAWDRVLVCDGPVDLLFNQAGCCRYLRGAGDGDANGGGLSTGWWWFTGIPENLIVLIGRGGPTSVANCKDPRELGPDDPMRRAWEWAEHYWAQASDVPVPKFEIRDNVVSAGREGTVRKRRFVGDQWRYTVHVDGKDVSAL